MRVFCIVCCMKMIKFELAILSVLFGISSFGMVTSTHLNYTYRFDVYPLEKCPKNAHEFETAAKRKNCTENSRYLCAPDKYLSNLIEFCTDRPVSLFKNGHCVRLEGTGDLNHYRCEDKFQMGCPTEPYTDEEIFKYPACLEINIRFHCFAADKDCPERLDKSVSDDFKKAEPINKTNTEKSDGSIKSHGAIVITIVCIVMAIVTGIIAFLVNKQRNKKEQRIKNREKINKDEEITVRHIRGIIVGCGGAGKTTLLERLKGTRYPKLKHITSTVIADVHSNCFEVLEEDKTIKYVDDLEKPAISLHRGMLQEERRNKTDQLETENFSKSESDSNEREEDTSDIKGENEDEQIIENDHYRTETIELLPVSDNIWPEERVIPKNKSKSIRRDEEAYEDENYSELLNDITKELNNELSNKKRLPPRVTFLDFAGQRMYYAFHQIYLSPKTFYILVVDMTKKLGDDVDELISNEFRPHGKDENGCSRFESWKYKDYYKYWLESINRFSDRNTPVIVVGTHAEELTKSDCVNFFNDLYALFKHHRHLKDHLHTKRMYAIRFPKEGTNLDELKEIKCCIAKIAQRPDFSEHKIRYSWAVSERFLRTKMQSKKIISKQELINYNSNFKDYSMKAKEIPKLLNFLYIVGTLLYFDEDDLKETIILDLQWFVDAFKRIIEYTVPEEETGDQKCQDFWSTGEISDSELEAIWKKYPVEGFSNFKTEILCYMERLELLAIFNAEHSKDSTWYYVPSMNPREFDMNGEEFMKSSILCFDFRKQEQLPILIFYSVILKCSKLNGWTIHKGEEDRKCIFKNVACFSFQGHILVICVCRLQIQVQVWIRNGHIDTKLLPEIQKSVEKIMQKFQKYSYEVGYKCQNGILNNEADKSFVEITEFPVTKDCTRCLSNSKPHSIDNKICWIKDSKKKVYTMEPKGAMSSYLDRSLIDEPWIINEINTEKIALRSVACLNDEEIWTCSGSSMRLYNLQDQLVKIVQTKSGGEPIDILVTRIGDLLYTDYDDKTVNIVKNTQIQTVIRLRGWKPFGVCSTSSGDLLILMNSNGKQSKVSRYTGSVEKQSIQYGDNKKPLFSPHGSNKYINENRNLDICVSDFDARSVLVVNQAGRLRFTYTGHPSATKEIFYPRGITTDSNGRILIADCNNHRIHILDQNGHFIRYIDNCQLDHPQGLCLDTRDNLVLTEWTTGKLKKIQYLI